MINLLDHLDPSGVRVGLTADSKQATLDHVVGLAIDAGLAGDADRLRTAVMQREAIVTTGIGRGVAVPHADLPEIEKPRLALGVFPEGVEFDSLDEEPVHLVFLLLGTPRTPGLHMKILARIARLSKDGELVDELRQATSPEDALSRLQAIEDRH